MSWRNNNGGGFGRGGRGGGGRGRGGGGGGWGDDSPFGDSMSDLGSGLRPIEWTDELMKPFERNFYVPHEDVKDMTGEDSQAWRTERSIKLLGAEGEKLDGDRELKPCNKFAHFSLPDGIMREINAAGFETPTPIQAQAIPYILSGTNVIGIAATGSGKTLAFVLPALVHIAAQPPLERNEGPVGLVLAPTRELAVQIQKECAKFGRSMRVRNTCVYGGASRGAQAGTLRRGVEIVIATPGRLIDFLESRTTNLKRTTYLVLDEADRMLDMGFEPQLMSIVSQIRPDRQTLFFSATWPKEVRRLARTFVGSDAVRVAIDIDEMKASANVQQIVDVCDQGDKYDKFIEVMKLIKGDLSNSPRVIVFTSTKVNCDTLEYELSQLGFRAASIHGDKNQRQRDWVLRSFRSGAIPVMVATDVAARGLDVKNVRFVINYDMANQVEDYVHRIGRTGRAGAKGIAYTFITQKDVKVANKLMTVLRKSNQDVPPKLEAVARMRGGRGGGGRGGRRYGGRGGRRGGYRGRR